MNLKSQIQRFNIQSYLQQRNIPFSQTGTGQFVLTCPQCHKPKLYINGEKNENYGNFLCFSRNCGDVRGNLVKLICMLENISFPQALTRLSGGQVKTYNRLTDIARRTIDSVPQSPYAENLPEIILPASFKPLEEPDEYLQQRGVNKEMIEQYDLHYCDVTKRIIFPIRLHEKLVGWQGRDILGPEKRAELFPEETQKFKYIKTKTSPHLKKNSVLLNYDNVKEEEVIVLVEGPFDSVKTRNSVALLGKHLSAQQLNLLLETRAKVVIVAIDPDVDSTERQKMIDTLKPFFKVYNLVLPDNTDPGSYSREEMDRFLCVLLQASKTATRSLKKVDLLTRSSV